MKSTVFLLCALLTVSWVQCTFDVSDRGFARTTTYFLQPDKPDVVDTTRKILAYFGFDAFTYPGEVGEDEFANITGSDVQSYLVQGIAQYVMSIVVPEKDLEEAKKKLETQRFEEPTNLPCSSIGGNTPVEISGVLYKLFDVQLFGVKNVSINSLEFNTVDAELYKYFLTEAGIHFDQIRLCGKNWVQEEGKHKIFGTFCYSLNDVRYVNRRSNERRTSGHVMFWRAIEEFTYADSKVTDLSFNEAVNRSAIRLEEAAKIKLAKDYLPVISEKLSSVVDLVDPNDFLREYRSTLLNHMVKLFHVYTKVSRYDPYSAVVVIPGKESDYSVKFSGFSRLEDQDIDVKYAMQDGSRKISLECDLIYSDDPSSRPEIEVTPHGGSDKSVKYQISDIIVKIVVYVSVKGDEVSTNMGNISVRLVERKDGPAIPEDLKSAINNKMEDVFTNFANSKLSDLFSTKTIVYETKSPY